MNYDWDDNLHLVMFGGKGGVGKTTLASGFARQWAQRFPEEKVLLLSTDPAHSLADILQVPADNNASPMPDLPNLSLRALDAELLLKEFKAKYGDVLELLVERGSFVEGEDLSPVWDMSWPGLDELMGLLEIQEILRSQAANRLVVDMAPTGHALNLLSLMDFLDRLLESVELFQEKHRVISRSFTGRYTEDEADRFLRDMKRDLAGGRELIQDPEGTAILLVAIAEPMSFVETSRFRDALEELQIPFRGVFVNRIIEEGKDSDRYGEQQQLLKQFLALASDKPTFIVPQLSAPPIGGEALDSLLSQIAPSGEQTRRQGDKETRGQGDMETWGQGDKEEAFPGSPSLPVPGSPNLPVPGSPAPPAPLPPAPLPPSSSRLSDFIAEGRQIIIVGGKGGVGKTTVAAALGWGLARQHPDRKVRVISIDPAHSLGDAFGQELGQEPKALTENLSGQEIDAEIVLAQFREDYLWELAEMMSGDRDDPDNPVSIAYGPKAWRQIVSQSLPGIDEILSLIEIIEQLETKSQDLIIIDSAPTGHLLRFLEMPEALSDWLAWIFKLWMKYQDVLGRTEFMGRLRKLRQKAVKAQKMLKNPDCTDFIGVVQAETAILSEARRLADSLVEMGIAQRYILHNRYQSGVEIEPDLFPEKTIVRLPLLPRSVEPLARIEAAAELLW